jgi:glucan-binding YG repeat protein
MAQRFEGKVKGPAGATAGLGAAYAQRHKEQQKKEEEERKKRKEEELRLQKEEELRAQKEEEDERKKRKEQEQEQEAPAASPWIEYALKAGTKHDGQVLQADVQYWHNATTGDCVWVQPRCLAPRPAASGGAADSSAGSPAPSASQKKRSRTAMEGTGDDKRDGGLSEEDKAELWKAHDTVLNNMNAAWKTMNTVSTAVAHLGAVLTKLAQPVEHNPFVFSGDCRWACCSITHLCPDGERTALQPEQVAGW